MLDEGFVEPSWGVGIDVLDRGIGVAQACVAEPVCEASVTWARSPGPGRPRSIGKDGAGIWVMLSQARQAKRGSTWRMTLNRAGS